LPRPLIVTAGRLVPWKNIDGVIGAVAAHSGASLAVIGDGPLRAELETLAREKLDGRFVFTGALSHKDTLAVMQSADVFALNSTYEGLSHLLIEALMLGAPTVAKATVEAKLLGDFKDKTKIVFKYHSKTRFKKKKGHRQPHTEVQITKI
jgi:ribosomal protein L21